MNKRGIFKSIFFAVIDFIFAVALCYIFILISILIFAQLLGGIFVFIAVLGGRVPPTLVSLHLFHYFPLVIVGSQALCVTSGLLIYFRVVRSFFWMIFKVKPAPSPKTPLLLALGVGIGWIIFINAIVGFWRQHA